MTKAPTPETKSKSAVCTTAPLKRLAAGPTGGSPRKAALPSGALSVGCSGIQIDPTGVRRTFQGLARIGKAQSADVFSQLLRALGGHLGGSRGAAVGSPLGWRSLPSVRSNHLLNQGVAHYIDLGEVGEGDPLDVAQDLTGVGEARGTTSGQVHLSHIPGNHRLAVEAQAGEEHLHLLDGGVLRLVENDECVVERAAAHEGKRRYLDRALVQKVGGEIDVQHVVQSIVERAQIGVYLLGQISWQKAELLPCLDRGPGEDDPFAAALLKRCHRHRHREVRLAGASRTDGKDDVVCPDGVHVPLLADALWHHLAIAGTGEDRAREDLLELPEIRRAAAEHLDRLLHILAVHRPASADEVSKLLDQLHRQGQSLRRAGQVQLAPPLTDANAQPTLNDFQVFVLTPAQGSSDVVVTQVNLGGGCKPRLLYAVWPQLVSFLLELTCHSKQPLADGSD